MDADNNMISDYYFDELMRANQLLAQNWNTLVKMRANGGLENIDRLIEAEMAYFHSLQFVLNTAESCVSDGERKRRVT